MIFLKFGVQRYILISILKNKTSNFATQKTY